MVNPEDDPEYRDVKIGEHVLFWDNDGVEYDALVQGRDDLILFLVFIREGRLTHALDVPHVSTKGTHDGCWTA